MNSFLEAKRAARRTVHETMARAAFYIDEDPVAEPLPVTVRLHYRFDKTGDMVGTNLSYTQTQEQVPALIFMRAEMAEPAVNAIVSIAPGVAYRIDNVLPPDDISVKAEVTPLLASETAGLPVPSEG